MSALDTNYIELSETLQEIEFHWKEGRFTATEALVAACKAGVDACGNLWQSGAVQPLTEADKKTQELPF